MIGIFLRAVLVSVVFYTSVGVSDIGLLNGASNSVVYEEGGRVHFKRCATGASELNRTCASSYTGTYSIAKESFIKNLQADYSIPVLFTGTQGPLLLSKRLEDLKATLEESNPLRDLNALRNSLDKLLTYQGRILKMQEGIYPYLSTEKNMVINHRDEQPLFQKIIDSFYTKVYDEESDRIFWIRSNVEVQATEGAATFIRSHCGLGSMVRKQMVWDYSNYRDPESDVIPVNTSDQWKRLLGSPYFGKELQSLTRIPFEDGPEFYQYDFFLTNGSATSTVRFFFGWSHADFNHKVIRQFQYGKGYLSESSSMHFDFVCQKPA